MFDMKQIKSYEDYLLHWDIEMELVSTYELKPSPYILLIKCETEAEYLKMIGENYAELIKYHLWCNDFTSW